MSQIGTPSEPHEMIGPSMNPPPYEERRRPRAQLSCTQCRRKKLKCDRGHPCDNCARRSQSHLCQYATPTVRSKTAQSRWMTGPGDIHSRIRHLEELVVSLTTENAGHQQKGVAGSTETHIAIPNDDDDDDNDGQGDFRMSSQDIGAQEQHTAETPGKMLVDRISTRWVDATHWQAILDDIAELKDCTEELEHTGDDTVSDNAADGNYGPTLFVGVSPGMSKSDLLACLPERPVVDRLVSRFFNTKEAGLMLLHVPTFYREYTQFWDDPREASMTWVARLFTILSYSVSFYHRVGDILPDNLGEPGSVCNAYRTRAAQCLILANYTRPGRYTIETLLLYLGTEFIRSSDTQLGVSVLLGVIVRLAMHMGYHRDSKHYPKLSVFDGEMRRRSWAVISQIDHLISFQGGLPRLIPDSQCDTELPHNLFDEDFDETAKVLPVSRPTTERTRVTYTIMKGKLMSVFGQIAEKTYSMGSALHEEMTGLDKRLQDTHASLPPFLRIRTMNLSITDPPDLIMERYNLELLYQKARCVLHRRYLTIHRSDLRYAYSRWACVDAASRILQHQNDIYLETLPGGQLYRERWFVSSLTSHDFLLAAMILCLELSCIAKSERPKLHPESDHAGLEGREGLLQSLEASYRIWMAFSETSVEACTASKALAVMLHNAKRSHKSSAQGEQQGGEQPAEDRQPKARGVSLEIAVNSPSNQITNQNMTGDSTSSVGMMLEDFDWDAWDNQVRYNNWENPGGTWIGSLDPAESQLRWSSPGD